MPLSEFLRLIRLGMLTKAVPPPRWGFATALQDALRLRCDAQGLGAGPGPHPSGEMEMPFEDPFCGGEKTDSSPLSGGENLGRPRLGATSGPVSKVDEFN